MAGLSQPGDRVQGLLLQAALPWPVTTRPLPGPGLVKGWADGRTPVWSLSQSRHCLCHRGSKLHTGTWCSGQTPGSVVLSLGPPVLCAPGR